jgi:hypothetical protein
MRWSLFFLILLFHWCCWNTTGPVKKFDFPELYQRTQYNDTADLPWSMNPDDDTGYFKGKIPERIWQLVEFDNTPIEQSFAALLKQDNIRLVDSETLSHSVLIDQQTKIRTDTLRNKNSVLISVLYFGEKEWQRATLNGKEIINYHWNGKEDSREVMMLFNENSFRHFSFYGKEYYYINACEAFSFGSSSGNVYYHFLWDKAGKATGGSQTCRFSKMLAGDADGDKNLDYLDFDNNDFCTTVPYSDKVHIQLYSTSESGIFVLQKDAAGKPWFIDARTGDDYSQDSLNITNAHWPRPFR